MKKIICLLCLCLCFSGCKKNDTNGEVNIVKKEPVEQKHSGDEIKNDIAGINNLQVITSGEVRSHSGDSLIIKGYVADVYAGEKVTYLNFENKFPKNIFSCAVFSGKYSEFGDLSKYKGRNVEVTGKITTFKNKLQVILNSKDQIKILD